MTKLVSAALNTNVLLKIWLYISLATNPKSSVPELSI